MAIGVVAAAIQCHIDPSGRVCAEPLNGFFIYQSAVGVDRDRQAQSFHFCVNLLKILSEKGLTAGEQQEKHPLLGTASPQIDPLCRGELLLFSDPRAFVYSTFDNAYYTEASAQRCR